MTHNVQIHSAAEISGFSLVSGSTKDCRNVIAKTYFGKLFILESIM